MTSAPSTSASAIERARRLRFCASVSTILSGLSAISSPKPSRRRPANEAAQSTLDQEDGKEHEEIANREREHLHGHPLCACALAHDAHAPSHGDHHGAGNER